MLLLLRCGIVLVGSWHRGCCYLPSKYCLSVAQPRSRKISVPGAAAAAAAVAQQQYNGGRVSNSWRRASSHGVCVRLGAAEDRTTTTFSRPMQRLSTHRRTSYQVYETYSSSKGSSSYVSMERPRSPVGLGTSPGYQTNPVPKGNLVHSTYSQTCRTSGVVYARR